MTDLELKTYALQVAAGSHTGDILKEAERIFQWLKPPVLAQKIAYTHGPITGAVGMTDFNTQNTGNKLY